MGGAHLITSVTSSLSLSLTHPSFFTEYQGQVSTYELLLLHIGYYIQCFSKYKKLLFQQIAVFIKSKNIHTLKVHYATLLWAYKRTDTELLIQEIAVSKR